MSQKPTLITLLVLYLTGLTIIIHASGYHALSSFNSTFAGGRKHRTLFVLVDQMAGREISPGQEFLLALQAFR